MTRSTCGRMEENHYLGDTEPPPMNSNLVQSIDNKNLVYMRQVGFFNAFRKQVPDAFISQKSAAQKENQIELSEEHLNRVQYCILIRRHPDRHEYFVEALGYETQSGYPRFARKFGADRFIRAETF